MSAIDVEMWQTATRYVSADLPEAGTVPAGPHDLEMLGADMSAVLALPPSPIPHAGWIGADSLLALLRDEWNHWHEEVVHWQGYLDRAQGDPEAIRSYCDLLIERAKALAAAQQDSADVMRHLLAEWDGQAAAAFADVTQAHARCWDPTGEAATRSADVIMDMAMASGRARYVLVEGLRRTLQALITSLVTAIGTIAGLLLMPAGVGLPAAFAYGWSWYHAATEFLGRALEQIVAEATAVCEPAGVEAGQLTRHTQQWHRAGTLLLTGRDEGAPATFEPPADGSWADQHLGPDATDLDPDLAILAQAAYEDSTPGPGEIVPGTDFTVATAAQLQQLGITQQMLDNPESGFHATIFVDSEGHYVVGYRGTEFGSDYNIDAAEDAYGSMAVSGQTADAIALAQAMEAAVGNENIINSGHSLGGRLAAAAAMATGSPAVTFNAAGVSEATLAQTAAELGTTPEQLLAWADQGAIRSYWTDDDILTQVQEDGVVGIDTDFLHDAPGYRINIGPGAHEDFVGPVHEHYGLPYRSTYDLPQRSDADPFFIDPRWIEANLDDS